MKIEEAILAAQEIGTRLGDSNERERAVSTLVDNAKFYA